MLTFHDRGGKLSLLEPFLAFGADHGVACVGIVRSAPMSVTQKILNVCKRTCGPQWRMSEVEVSSRSRVARSDRLRAIGAPCSKIDQQSNLRPCICRYRLKRRLSSFTTELGRPGLMHQADLLDRICAKHRGRSVIRWCCRTSAHPAPSNWGKRPVRPLH
jgi:hypothetical protein